MFFEGSEKRRLQGQDRKDALTWAYRYLRLHGELSGDPVYRDMYGYCRAELVAYLREDVNDSGMDDERLGDLIDELTDLFNRTYPDRVNAYKPMIDELYANWTLPTKE